MDTTTNDERDPRLDTPDGDEGMPGEVLDTPSNMPGDQPTDGDQDRPTKTDLERGPG